ncbi:MAG TPA: phosphohistidine phosphatase SixA, partial [Burkholderiales bacterium]
MDLVLWRHAEAVDGTPDMARKLTPKGEKQAKETAAWLKARLPKETRILVSPAKRSLQTAQALSDDFEVVKDIAPGASVAALLSAAGWPDNNSTVLVVGHQPTLGMVAAMLIAGEPMPWSVRKSGV